MGSRQLPNLTEDERSRVLTPEQVCKEGPAEGGVDSELCAYLDTARNPPPLELDALFLGPRGENADLVEDLVVRAIRDHVAWRRSFHPEDLPVLPGPEGRSAQFRAFWESFEQELLALLAELRADVPVFSPRYLSHFVSDLSLPALLGYVAAMLYNPNNVSWEASTIATLLELEVGRDLARMLGFGRTPAELERTWGHLTSGGTVANLESLWLAKSAKLLPLSIRAAARKLDLSDALTAGPFSAPIGDLSAWELVNLSFGEVLDLRDSLFSAAVAARSGTSREAAVAATAAVLAAHDVRTLGDRELLARLEPNEQLEDPVIVVPQTMHYGWTKAARVLGLGSRQLVTVPLDRRFHMDPMALRAVLERCHLEHRPVLQVVGVAGTTEEGAVDAMDRLVALREEMAGEGLGFSVHCDAAFGGYFMSCFREPSGDLRSLEEVRAEYGGWPSQEVYQGFAALSEVDSATIDPHKLGYVPYPAGAVIFRDGRARELLAQEAPYALGGREAADAGHRPGIYLGRYTLEGSKPGAAAAAVCLAHRVVPLDRRGYGKLLGQTVRIARDFAERLRLLGRQVSDELVVAPLCEPDTNVVVFLVNIAGNRRLDVMNRFTRAVYQRFSVQAQEPVTRRGFIVSHTELEPSSYPSSVVRPLLEELVGIPGDRYRQSTGSDATENGSAGADDHVTVLRSAMLNPFAQRAARDGRDYLDLFLAELFEVMRQARVDIGNDPRDRGSPPVIGGRGRGAGGGTPEP